MSSGRTKVTIRKVSLCWIDEWPVSVLQAAGLAGKFERPLPRGGGFFNALTAETQEAQRYAEDMLRGSDV